MSAPFYPIIYVRGYAATQGEINATVDDPFYGFSMGSTHIRVGAQGEPVPFFFESPLVRLMSEHGYVDAFHGPAQALGQENPNADRWRTVWIHRFYDVTANTYSWKPNRLTIEDAARALRELIARVKEETGAPMVHLVAHSMGGLVCRSLLQKIYPEAHEDPKKQVSRFFTYATPHGGIQMRSGLGFMEKLRDFFGPFDSDTFGPNRMYAFLTPGKTPKAKAPSSFDPRASTGAFDPDRVFCAVGTNAGDYDVAAGLSSASVGPQSDGLVQIEAAYVFGTHRAYVHRCHSGRYGIVNSEEAFQNLERFLFGTIQAIVSLQNLTKLPAPKEKSYQLDVQVAVRGLPVFMNERTRAHYCPVVLNDFDKLTPGKPVDLFTQFLNARRSASGDGTCRFAITFGLYEFGVVDGKVDYSRSLHGLPNWYDTLLVDVKLGDGAAPSLNAWWTAPEPDRAVDATMRKIPQGWSALIALPEGIARTLLGPDASLKIDAYDWTD